LESLKPATRLIVATKDLFVSIELREFRNVLGQFATGIAIVTATVDGNRIGATISSFNSVSLDPPLVLFSLVSKSFGIAQWKAAPALSIFILGEQQADLSNRFARAGADKWADFGDKTTSNGAPWLPGAIASFDCAPHAIYPGGDHDIFVCEVKAFSTAGKMAAPLIFHGGKYRTLTAIEAGEAPPNDNMWLHGW
jgi:flavin reductase (DIM6/NTAB) family NADH-FMN oxidoreductase RutF